jgi:hypothetical protein
MSAFIARALARALAAGHVGVLADKTRTPATGASKADDKATVYLTQYLPTAVQDWRTNVDGSIAAVKLRENVASTDLLEPHKEGDAAVRMLLWDAESWARVDKKADGPLESDTHDLGTVPFAVLTPKPLERWALVGKSLLGNANVIRALFNRASEEDQVLRDQAFSLLTINVPTDGDVEKVKNELGSETGTTRAIVTHGQADYITADMEVPKAIRDNIAYLVREIYRMAFLNAAVRESLEAETAEAIRLKQDDLNDFLVSIADACRELELALIRFWCGWVSTDQAAAETLFESLDLTINYEREFFLEDLGEDLKNWALGLKMDLGATMEKRIRLKAAFRLEPTLSEDDKAAVEKEVEAIANKPKPDPMAIAASLRAAAGGRVVPPPQKAPPKPGEEGAAAA